MPAVLKRRNADRPGRRTEVPAFSGPNEAELKVGGKTLKVSNLNKVFYPQTGFTKGQIIDYHIRISPALLPHLKGHPVSLKRYPNGVEGEFFYEKKCPAYRPGWVETAAMWSETNQADIHLCMIDDLPSLIWAVNLADLELHTYLAKKGQLQRPSALVFDLDPGPPANILQCCQVGLQLRDLLNELNLESFPKTSGSKGLQVYAPLNTPSTFEQTKAFARRVAEVLEREHPELVVSKMAKVLRRGKVLVDWSQNDDHKTTVCAYSLRAKEKPTVSTPVAWKEVEAALKKKDGERLVFTSDEVLRRVDKLGDLFSPVLTLKQKLPAIEKIDSL